MILSEPTLTFQLPDESLQVAHLREINHMLVMLLSHELGTPLTHVLAYLRLQQERASVSERIELDLVVNQALTLKSRLDDLLLLDQLEAGTLDLQSCVVHIQEIIMRVIDAQRWRAEEKGLALRTHIECPRPVHGDKDLLYLAIEHVVSNACKFSNSPGTVEVHARCMGRSCYITVADEGIGIAPEKQSQIFDPFYQVDLTRARRYNGLGIGLKLVRAIIEKHNGMVQVTSQIGKGSTFTLSVPLA